VSSVREISYLQALREGLREEFRRDPRVFMLGEDLTGGYGNGDFGVTRGMIEEFGPERIRDTPISEGMIVGAAVGAALGGTRPIAEIMYMDFMTYAVENICNVAAKINFLHPHMKCPIVVRSAVGAGIRSGPNHSQSLHSWFAHIPGLKVLMPAEPADAKGLIKSAIREDSPVLFLEHKLLYGRKGPVPEEEYVTPIGRANVTHAGDDVTIVAASLMARRALEAAKQLEAEGVSAEVVDLRTIKPFDREAVASSVKKTGKMLVVDEGYRTCGFAAEVIAAVVEDAFEQLRLRPVRLTNPDSSIPCAPALEDSVIPSVNDIKLAAKRLAS
jgi:pyruvate/2-oxoglutarate/acetoin dehydrogenase E1 component